MRCPSEHHALFIGSFAANNMSSSSDNSTHSELVQSGSRDEPEPGADPCTTTTSSSSLNPTCFADDADRRHSAIADRQNDANRLPSARDHVELKTVGRSGSPAQLSKIKL